MTAPYDPNQHIQVVTKPGGLSGAAHAVHILIVVFTCGLWLPGYIVFMMMAPRQRFEVVAPYGADPQLVARAQLEAEQRSRARSVPNPGSGPAKPGDDQKVLARVGLIVVGMAVVLCGLAYLWQYLSR